MAYPITDIEGIDAEAAATLKALGIRSTRKLLEAAKTSKRRMALSERIGINEERILKWVNMADRMRIKGVGWEYAALLQAVGVDTVKELKSRNPARLARAMMDANTKLHLVRLLPSEKLVSRWIEEAKRLPAAIAPTRVPSVIRKTGAMHWSHQAHSPKASARAYKAEIRERLLHHAQRVFGDRDFAEKWLRGNNPALKNRVPMDVADSQAGEQEVEAVLSHFAHGDYS